MANRLYYGGQSTVASISTNAITLNAPVQAGLTGLATSNLFFAGEPIIVYNNSSGASRGTTTVSSVSGNVINVASAPASIDADDVVLPTIATASASTLSPLSMKNASVYMGADGLSQGKFICKW